MPSRKHKIRGRNVARGSQRDPEIRKTVAAHVRSLIELYEMTDPIHGAKSEDDKLERARHAIGIWWYLYGELLLWAQSQITGYEYGRSNPEFIHKLSRIFGREITVDSHLLEYIGLGYSWNRVNYDDPVMDKIEEAMDRDRGGGLDERAMRFLIRELLVSGSANSSYWRFELQAALYALNFGEIDDLVKPTPGKRHGNAVQLQVWKATALDHVYYHVGKGLKKYKALQLVADAIGQSPETI